MSRSQLDLNPQKYGTSSQEVITSPNTDSNPAWLSIESTIEEINVIQQYFKISGCLTVFWQDNQFDEEGTLTDLDDYKSYSITKIENLLSLRMGTNPPIRAASLDPNPDDIKTNAEKIPECDQKFKIYHRPSDLSQQKSDFDPNSPNYKQPSFVPSIIANINSDQKEEKEKESNTDKPKSAKPKRRYIDLTHIMPRMIQKYPLPFVPSIANDGNLILFKNALEFNLTGYKPIDLDYNIDHHAFNLRIQFKATLYECFENNNNEFPFEWQFLNLQIPYRMDTYDFKSQIPEFVEKAFCHDDYHEHAKALWKHAVLVRKLDNIDEWKLLKPWVDLRKEDDYGHKFEFGLIKYRVRRNPHYYMLEMIIPLFLMVSCVFCVLLPAWDDAGASISDRLGYIITLLLAVAAFQISIVDDMPYKSQFTLIDEYFLLAYMILVGMVIEQSVEQSIDVENDIYLSVWFGGGLGLLWLMHSLTFILKYVMFSNFCNEWTFGNFLNFITCGSGRFFCTFRDCCIIKGFCCKSKRREIRLKHWMEMELNEAASWDTTKRLKSLSERAEMILGTFANETKRYYANTGRTENENEYFKDYREDIIEELIVKKKKDRHHRKNESVIFDDRDTLNLNVSNINNASGNGKGKDSRVKPKIPANAKTPLLK